MRRSPLLFGHRGAPRERPENTLPSFARALEVGADVLETDVHCTADGALVLAHDATGARTAGRPEAIRDIPYRDVARWDVGYGFLAADGSRPLAGRGYRVPRLEDALDAFPAARVNLDIKDPRPRVVTRVLDVLRRRGAQGRVRLASFFARAVGLARARGYAGETALSQVEALFFLAAPARVFRALPATGSAAQLPTRAGPRGELSLARREVVAKAHRAGLRIDFWTVNDLDLAATILDMGADGVITDDPAALYPIFARRRGDEPTQNA